MTQPYSYLYSQSYFCSYCGTWVINGAWHTCNPPLYATQRWTVTYPTVATPQAGWLCPACGSGVAPWMAYCPHCKSKPEEATPEESAPP